VTKKLDFHAILEEIHADVKPLLGQGKVADYIPALAEIDPNQIGMAIVTIAGDCYSVGDADEKFSIQSISKVFNLALGIRILDEQIWERVGKEPSGSAFNSLVQLEYEKGIPRNPFINAGALVITDILLDHLDQPNIETIEFVRKLGCAEARVNKATVQSEKDCGFTNLALVNLMKAHGNINHAVDDVLDVYYHQCSIEMSCVELARSFLFLANGGIMPEKEQRFITASQAKRINAIMLTCGFYDEAGEFAYKVGLPGKSGVGGGIVAVIPGELAIAIWSPELNSRHNSVVGIRALELFTTRTGMSVF
jgi:glutaminase